MKTVLFLRHGKSDWDAPFEHDHERPLAKRGRKASRKVGRFLRDLAAPPDHIFTSTAVRARQTLEEARAAGGWEAAVEARDELYEADAAVLLQTIRAAPADSERLLLVGHQPTWGATVSRLTGGSALVFPTAALACVEVEVDRWDEVAWGRGQLRWLIPPKLLP